MVTSRLLPEPEKQAIVMVHVRRFPSQWVYVWKTTKPFLSPIAQVGAIKLITQINDVNLFLENLGKLYEAFSVRLKHKRVNTSSLPEVAEKVNSLDVFLKGTVSSLQSDGHNSTKKTNGPEGTIASKTIDSVAMIRRGLHNPKNLIRKPRLIPKAC